MDRMLYIAAADAGRVEEAQAVHAHNLANVSTDGYRAEFSQALHKAVEGPGYQARDYGLMHSPGFDHSPGTFRETGRNLDVAVVGEGFLAVQMPDGSEGFTRDGALRIDNFGRLVTIEGYQVQGGSGPIALPEFEKIVLGRDGSVTIRPLGQGADTLVQLDNLKLVNPNTDELVKTPAGVFARKDGVVEPFAEDMEIASGVLESSNVNPVGEMIEILSLARQFELEVKLMQTAQENDEAATALVRMG